MDLVLHLPVIAAVAVADHPLDPSPDYHCGTVRMLAWNAPDDLAALVDDAGRDPEYLRAVANSEAAHLAAGA